MILNALYTLDLEIRHPSNADDCLLMKNLLSSKGESLNCENAGTVMRFLMAYCAASKRRVLLTGSKRMWQRPVGNLAEALENLGAKVTYIEKKGYPPIQIDGTGMKGGNISIPGATSSQFITALMLIGPKFSEGLTIEIEGIIASYPYIQMTQKVMQSLGFEVILDDNVIRCKAWDGVSSIHTFDLEPDWSSVVFWFQIIHLSESGKVFFERLTLNSVQGDAVLAEWSLKLGLKLTETESGVWLEKSNTPIENITEWDFSNYPDLAPAVIALLSVNKKRAGIKGLETLKIKESNRVLALQTELKKCGVELVQGNVPEVWLLDASNFELKEGTEFDNYNDHRIAMCLAVMGFIKPIKMKNTSCVSKSYPHFWEHLGLRME